MSELEDTLAFQLRAAKLEPVRQYKAIPGRRFAFDFAFPEQKLLVEVDGGVWTGGRHVTGAGFSRDSEKYSLAAAYGYRVVRCTGEHVKDGRALLWIEQALKAVA